MMSFEGKTIIVTGGAKGIGKGCVNVFHREGGNVVALDVDDEVGSELSENLNDRFLFIHCDVSSEKQVSDAMKRAADHFGRIDVLVNNAGILHYATVTEETEKEWDSLFNINLKGAFLCAKHAIPYMQKIGEMVAFVASEKGSFITGEAIRIDGGIGRSVAGSKND